MLLIDNPFQDINDTKKSRLLCLGHSIYFSKNNTMAYIFQISGWTKGNKQYIVRHYHILIKSQRKSTSFSSLFCK